MRVDDFTFHKTFREDDVLHLRPVLDGLYQSYYKLVSAAMKATSDANQRFLTYVIDTITAVPADAGASVQVLVGDKEIDNGTAPAWAAGSNTVTVNVTAAAGAAYLDLKRGAPADYDVDGLPRSLLMEYVRYGRDDALDVFEHNYQALLLSMRHDREVKEYASASIPSGE